MKLVKNTTGNKSLALAMTSRTKLIYLEYIDNLQKQQQTSHGKHEFLR